MAKNSKNRIASLASIAVRVASVGLGYVTSMLLTRTVSPENFGVFTFTLAIVSFLAIPGQHGLATLVMRETARLSRASQWSYVRGLWRWAAKVAIVGSTILAGLLLALLYAFRSSIPDDYFTPAVLALPLVLILSLLGCAGASARGLGKLVGGQIPEFLVRPAVFILLVFAWGGAQLKAGSLTDASVLIIGQVVATALALVMSQGYLASHRPSELRRVSPTMHRSSWMSSVLPLMATSSVFFIVSYSDIIMLGLLGTSKDVAVYRVISQTSLFVAFFLQAINAIVAPQFARAASTQDTQSIQSIINWSASLTMMLAVPFALVLVLLATPFLTLVFGDVYADGSTAMVILIIGQLCNVAAGSVTILLTMTGHEKIAAFSLSTFAAGNIVLNAVLIPIYGINGAAIATAISLGSSNFYLRRVVRRLLGVESSALFISHSWRRRRG